VWERLLGFAGIAMVAAAVFWAVAGGATAPVITLVVIGMVFALADAAVWRTPGDDVADLDVPPGRRLPPPPRGMLVLAAAALGVLAALAVGVVPLAAVAALIGVVAFAQLVRPRGDAVLLTRTVNTARRLRAFVRAHGVDKGQSADGYLTAVGESGSRLLVVAPDGAWADAMLGDDAAAVIGLARITLREPGDPLTGRKLRIGPGLWERMTDSW
jgi:hypothetical protein